MSLSLLTLNIERREHLDLIKPFLARFEPDIACFQEIFEDTYEILKEELGMDGMFSHRATIIGEERREGIAMLSKYPVKKREEVLYDKFEVLIPGMQNIHAHRPLSRLQIIEVEKDGAVYRIGNTHFTWSDDGQVTNEQRVNLQSLLEATKPFPELVLVGDFNTPRGREIYTALSEHFTDTIPLSVETTIDGERHRAGFLKLVVDGVFSRGYSVAHVQIQKELSDHYGITAEISTE